MIQEVDKLMGALFYRRVAPAEIKEMPIYELRYWSRWHDSITQAVVDAAED